MSASNNQGNQALSQEDAASERQRRQARRIEQMAKNDQRRKEEAAAQRQIYETLRDELRSDNRQQREDRLALQQARENFLTELRLEKCPLKAAAAEAMVSASRVRTAATASPPSTLVRQDQQPTRLRSPLERAAESLVALEEYAAAQRRKREELRDRVRAEIRRPRTTTAITATETAAATASITETTMETPSSPSIARED